MSTACVGRAVSVPWLFHPFGGNAPGRRVKVEFIPPRLNRFAWAAERQSRGDGFIALPRRAATDHLGDIEEALVLGLVGRQCLAHRIDWI